MLRGIYTATSGMLTAQRDINVRGNNLANLSTAGFKSDRLVATTFAEAMAIRQQPRTTGRHIDITGTEEPFNNYNQGWEEEMEAALSRLTLSRGRTALEVMTDFSQGGLQMTERSLDFALVGEGFFVIQSNRGEYDEEDNPYGVYGGVYFTRNGQFQISDEEPHGAGHLINGLGDLVLDVDGSPIEVETDNFIVSEMGEIYRFDPETGVYDDYVATIGVFVPDNPHLLIKNGDNIFSILNEDFEPEELEFSGAIRQSYIERANTDVAAEMAGMITASRSFQSMSQILKAIDAALARSISEVGRV